MWFYFDKEVIEVFKQWNVDGSEHNIFKCDFSDNSHTDYVYMPSSVPYYSEYDMGHVNWKLRMDIPNVVFSHEDVEFAGIIQVLGAFFGHI